MSDNIYQRLKPKLLKLDKVAKNYFEIKNRNLDLSTSCFDKDSGDHMMRGYFIDKDNGFIIDFLNLDNHHVYGKISVKTYFNGSIEKSREYSYFHFDNQLKDLINSDMFKGMVNGTDDSGYYAEKVMQLFVNHFMDSDRDIVKNISDTEDLISEKINPINKMISDNNKAINDFNSHIMDMQLVIESEIAELPQSIRINEIEEEISRLKKEISNLSSEIRTERRKLVSEKVNGIEIEKSKVVDRNDRLIDDRSSVFNDILSKVDAVTSSRVRHREREWPYSENNFIFKK